MAKGWKLEPGRHALAAKGVPTGRKSTKQPKINGSARTTAILLTNREESPYMNDFGKFQVIQDKIRVNGEQYENFESAFNSEDASMIRRIMNEKGKELLGVEFPMTVRRYVQNGIVSYELYWDRWSVRKDGQLIEKDLSKHPNWGKFKNEVRRLVGVF